MSESTEQIRQKASELARRIQSDAAFKAQVAKNPEATLTAAGLPAAAIPDVLAATELGGDVKGYSCFISTINL